MTSFTTLPSEGVPRVDRSSDRYRRGDVVADRYELLEPIGAGGSGEVWLAEHTILHTKVALKLCIEPQRIENERTRAQLAKFRFEAQVSAQLGCKTRHIVLVHDAGIDARGPFVAMEHVEGRALDEILRREGPLSLERTATMIAHVADALRVAHAAGIIHRDIKPANILVATDSEGESFKLTDFGIAKAAPRHSIHKLDPQTRTEHGLVVGTPDYLSPERVRGERADAGADVWALAVVAYEAITGEVPFQGKHCQATMLAILQGVFEPPSKLVPGAPRELEAFFKRAFHEERAERFASGTEMSEALGAIAKRSKRSPRRRPRAIAVAVVAAVIAAAALLVPSRLPATAATPSPSASCAGSVSAEPAPSAMPIGVEATHLLVRPGAKGR